MNPQAVNEGKPRRYADTPLYADVRLFIDLNVFTKNKRSVMLLNANLGPGRERTPVALVAIGGKSLSLPIEYDWWI